MMKSIKYYKNNQLFRDFLFKKKIKNVMNYPKMDKILLSLTDKEVLLNNTKLFVLLMLLKLISGQKPKITKAQKSIAQFKLREGKAIGCKITLRKEIMYFFLDKIIYSILPQIIELNTTQIKSNFNSLNIGIENLSIFSELESQYELLKNTQGFNITLVLKNNRLKTNSDYFFSGIKIPIQR
jgi:large subunit ribosomal protein L5